MRIGGRLALGLAMLVLATATPLACGDPFVLDPGSGGGGGKDGGPKADSGNVEGGGGGEPICVEQSASQIYGDCHVVHKCSDGNLVNDVAIDVYDDGNPCTEDTCQGEQSNNVVMTGKPCPTPEAKTMCSASGECVQCLADLNCTTPMSPKCDTGKCVPATCRSTTKDATETDIDCGGKDCKPCADLASCLDNSDCASGVCSGVAGNKKCRPPNCGDMVLNGNETDKDCGGDICVAQGAPCIDEKKCRKPTDCVSGVCKVGVCQAPSCTDGVKNGMETGVDCGSDCPACP